VSTFTARSFISLVEEADPDWRKDRLRPVVYVIPKNGRKFYDPYPLYHDFPTPSPSPSPSPGGSFGILTEDGSSILQEDGGHILTEDGTTPSPSPSPSPAGDSLQTESGDFIVQEDGSRILL
jgi:hypothetical protein